MLLDRARLEVKSGALRSQDVYDDIQVDRALQIVLDDLINYTGCTYGTDTVAIGSSTTSQNLATSALADLMPGYFTHARIGNDLVKKVAYQWVRRRLAAYPNVTGKPTHMAFEIDQLAWFYPKTDTSYTLSVTWHPDLVSWVPGAANPGEITINISDRFLKRAVWEGCAAMLVYGEATGNPWPVTAWNRYTQFREELKQQCQVESGAPRPRSYVASAFVDRLTQSVVQANDARKGDQTQRQLAAS